MKKMAEKTELKQIQDALLSDNYELAEWMLQDYLTKTELYDDMTAIFDAALGRYYKDWKRVWSAVRRGLMHNCRNYELYLMLGEYCLQNNPCQSYLCYENALFYCNDLEDQEEIRKLLYEMEAVHKIHVNKTAILIQSCDALEQTRLCIKSIHMTTPESAREIVIADHGIKEAMAEVPEKADILFLSDDTLLTENALFWLRMGLYDRKENGAAGSVTNTGQDRYPQIAEGVSDASDLFVFGEQTNIPWKYPYEMQIFLSGFALLVRRAVIEQAGLPEESLGDLKYEDFGLRLSAEGYQNVLCKNSFIIKTKKQHVGCEENLSEERRKIDEKWGFHTKYYLGVRRDLLGLIMEPEEQPLHVLEIGCGCGAVLAYIKSLHPNAEVYGVELISEVAKIAVHFGNVLCGDVEQMDYPWEEEFFDYIIMGDVLEHLSNPELVLRKLRKHLRTGGHILISMPNVKHYSVLLPLICQDIFPYSDSGILDRTHVKMYTGTEIKNLIWKSGYEIEAMGGHLYGVPGEKEQQMIDILTRLMEEPSRESFMVYQYVVKATKRQV